jgi:hypothetical protein
VLAIARRFRERIETLEERIRKLEEK